MEHANHFPGVPASQTTVPAFKTHGLRWVVAHDGENAKQIVTELAANFGTWSEVAMAIDYLTKCGATGVRVIDLSA